MNATKLGDITKPRWWRQAVIAAEDKAYAEDAERNAEEYRQMKEQQQRVATYAGKLIRALQSYGVFPTGQARSTIKEVGDKIEVDGVLFRLSGSDTLNVCMPCCFCKGYIDYPLDGTLASLGEALLEMKDELCHVECWERKGRED